MITHSVCEAFELKHEACSNIQIYFPLPKFTASMKPTAQIHLKKRQVQIEKTGQLSWKGH